MRVFNGDNSSLQAMNLISVPTTVRVLWASGALLGINGTLSGLIDFTNNPIQGLVLLAFGAAAFSLCGGIAIMVQSTYEAAIQARKTSKQLDEISALIAAALAPGEGTDA